MRFAFFLIGIFYLFSISVTSAQVYSVTDLGVFNTPYDINSSGQVTGSDASAIAFVYSGGTMTQLDPDTYSGNGINSTGVVAGTLFGGSGGYFSYSGGTLTDIGSLGGGWSASYSGAINDSGTIVGSSWNASFSNFHAFSYSGGTMTDLGTINVNSAYSSYAWDVNNSGQVVGGSDSDTGHHAYIYSGGTMTDLGTFGGNYSEAYGINSSGQVVGVAKDGSGNNLAFSWTSGGGMVSIGSLGGDAFAQDINTSGDIVGYSSNTPGFTGGAYDRAFIYTGGMLIDLNTLLDGSGSGWVLQYAYALNDSGSIVGVGTFGGLSRGFLLTPVPEPSAWFLFMLGLAGICFIRRRSHA